MSLPAFGIGVGSMRQGVEAQVRVGELVLLVELVENVAEAGDVIFVDDGVGRRPAVSVPERSGVQDGVPSADSAPGGFGR